MTMELTSESFKDGELLADRHVLSAAFGFGCEGGNLSPHLAWSGVPDGTQSFTVTCFDPDAPTGSGFWHWVVANIPANVTSLSLGASSGGGLPRGALETRTDVGKPGYAGPCPPEGDNVHRYIFTVHAVKVPALQVTADTSAAVVGFQLHFNTLEKAKLIGLYRR